MKTVLFIGRWQPLHSGHKSLVREALDMGYNVVIGVRDTKKDKDNPFGYRARRIMINRAFKTSRVSVIRIPDKGCDLDIWVGRKVGYRVVKLAQSVEEISGTKIRELLREAEE